MELVWLHQMLIHMQHVAAVTWLSLAQQTSLQAVLWDSRGCDGLTGLEEEQVPICQQQVEAMEAVKQGTELAVFECQHQFHWNCSTLQGLQVFGKATMQGWQLLPAPEDLLAAMKVECKCHGLSGSCQVPACWKLLPPFRHVGNVLKEECEGAAEVFPKRVGSCLLLVPRGSRFKPYTAHSLLYMRASPDLCEWDPRHGTLGTSGPQCEGTWPARDGCELRCCGRVGTP